MKRREACIIVLKNHNLDGLLKNWLFASSKEEALKARKTYCSVRGVGGERATVNKIKDEVERAIQKTFYTLHNLTTDEVSYHAVNTYKESLRTWMINHLDMSCEYDPTEGYITVERKEVA